MTMFQKVKQLFNGRGEGRGSGEGRDDESGHPGLEVLEESRPPAVVRVPSYMQASNSSKSITSTKVRSAVGGAASNNGVAVKSGMSATLSATSFTRPGGIGTSQGSMSSLPRPHGGAAVPAVAVSRAAPARAVVNVLASHAGSPVSPSGTSRRKSTPAALDMALRTLEGRAAVQDLLAEQTIKKPMAFAQYFGAQPPQPGLPQQPGGLHPHPPGGASATGPRQPLAVRMGGPPSPVQPGAGSPMGGAGAAASPLSTAADTLPSPSAAGEKQVRPAVNNSSEQRPPIATPTFGSGTEPHSKLLTVSQNLPASMARQSWSLSDYSIIRKMYTGYASTVYHATCKKTAEQVALKVYHMENLCELNHFQVYREIRVHSTLQHQNIVHLFAAFKEGHDVVLVQEYAEGGDLYRLLHRNGGRLSERQAVEMVLHPFLLAMQYLHTRGIMHRDIKPENVLFTEHRVLKLADFGLAIDLTEERAVTRAGTLDYMAPEVLRCPPKNSPGENKNNVYLHYNNSVDAWAVGVFAYELVVGLPPFAGETQLDSVDKIMHSTPEFPEKMTELAKAFICQALKKHPGDRPTVIEMLHNPWIRSYQRRASVLHMPAPRARRSSTSPNVDISGAPGGSIAAAAFGAIGAMASATAATAATSTAPSNLSAGASGSLTRHAEGAGCGSTLAKLPEGNTEDMSPTEIEEMIRKLMVAKQAAMDRASGGGRASSALPNYA
ncbi:hypothetical protein FOA52_011180 [Chlamydomonas sp. UWO 241]|nr:hypothetical protein FOA52_011180 [Chlamydomonas sp. UWO 241]